MQQVIITISKNGQMTVEVNGVQGTSCRDLTEKFRTLGEVVSDDNTAEYYEEATVEDVVGVGV